MKSVFSARDDTEAQLFKNVLTTEGIRSVILPGDEYLLGEQRSPACVCVPDEDYERAAGLANDFRTAAPQNPWKWRCECGEDLEEQFAVCWNCGRERPNQ